MLIDDWCQKTMPWQKVGTAWFLFVTAATMVYVAITTRRAIHQDTAGSIGNILVFPCTFGASMGATRCACRMCTGTGWYLCRSGIVHDGSLLRPIATVLDAWYFWIWPLQVPCPSWQLSLPSLFTQTSPICEMLQDAGRFRISCSRQLDKRILFVGLSMLSMTIVCKILAFLIVGKLNYISKAHWAMWCKYWCV